MNEDLFVFRNRLIDEGKRVFERRLNVFLNGVTEIDLLFLDAIARHDGIREGTFVCDIQHEEDTTSDEFSCVICIDGGAKIDVGMNEGGCELTSGTI